jgi:hypothetical protein
MTPEQKRAIAIANARRRRAEQETAAPAEPQLSPENFLATPEIQAMMTDPKTKDSGVAKFLAGVGYSADQTSRGIGQITGDVPQALELAQEEAASRKVWEKFDEGVGMEDVGENAAFLASLFIPGLGEVGAASKIPAVVKTGTAIAKKLTGTTGGIALMAGVNEALKGKTADESRGMDAAVAAGTTAVAGIGSQKLVDFMRKSGSTGLIGSILVSAGMKSAIDPTTGRVLKEGMIRRALNRFAPRHRIGDPVVEDLTKKQGSAILAAAKTSQKLEIEAAKAAAAGKSGGPPGTQEWKTFISIVDAFEKASKRHTDLSKAVGIDRGKAIEPLIATVRTNSLRITPEGFWVLDIPKMADEWNKLKSMEGFKELYATGRTGTNTAVKKMDAFVKEAMKGPQVATAEDVYIQAAQKAWEKRNPVVDEMEKLKMPQAQKEDLKRKLAGPFVAYVTASMEQQGVTPEDMMEAFAGEEGFMNQLDFFLTLEEQAEKFRREQSQGE